ncbi:glycosyltransferase [Paenibacillus solani]|uniref:glycosyltransferase n=1 Tax=Paenibacillus solani TaxID=1705565 RepID=UPI003D2AD8F1
MLSISVCMIVKNEASCIESCLSSVSKYVREIIVVDTGSIDETKEIALKYTSNVYEFQWINDFSAARNFAISKASQSVILMMDADEMLNPESLPLLMKYCAEPNGSAGRVRQVNQLGNGETGVIEIARLMPNDKTMKYTGRIHEQITKIDGDPPRVISTGVELFHSGYSKEVIMDQNKIKRNLDLLTLELSDHPDNPYIWYQLGKTNYVAEKYLKANSQFQQAIDLVVGKNDLPPYLPNLLVSYVYSLLKTKEFDKILSIVEVCTDLYPDFTDIYFVYGIVLMELKDINQIEQIRETFEYCIHLGEADTSKYETVHGVGSYRAYYNLGVYYEAIGEAKKAVEYYKMAVQSGYSPAAERIKSIDSNSY